MKKKHGFSLIELLVSISIIAILMALAIVSFGSAQVKARDARRMQDMSLLQKAAEQYYMIAGSKYPNTGAVVSVGTTWASGSQTILESFPQDPRSVGSSYVANVTDTTYCICAKSEGNVGNSTSDACTFGTNTGTHFCVKNQQ